MGNLVWMHWPHPVALPAASTHGGLVGKVQGPIPGSAVLLVRLGSAGPPCLHPQHSLTFRPCPLLTNY